MAVENITLKVENLSFSYDKTRIFSELDFEVKLGETLCLLGPNGSGKTTLLDCILGTNKPEKGKVLLNGQDTHQLSPKLRAQKIAYVPQKHNCNFSFSVEDVLLTGRAPYIAFNSSPTKEDRALVRDLLASVDMLPLANRDYTSLSGGEMQLVMILRALVQDTQLIILDEPTAHLDFHNELWVLETIVNLAREKEISIVMATHFPNHAFYLENAKLPVKILFMGSQKQALTGLPKDILSAENIKKYYNIESIIQQIDLPNKNSMDYIIPLQTVKNR